MANYWKDKVIPKIKKVFEKNGAKKAAAAEATKTFDEAKEQYAKEFEDKKTELQPKVIEIYEATSTEVKGVIKAPKESGFKKHSAAVQKFLDELVKIEFPGSKAVSEASTKFGPAYVSGPVSFVFEKVSTFIVVEEKKEEAPAAAAEGETTTAAAPAEETSTEAKEKEIVVEGEKKEEAAAAEEAAAPEKTQAPAAEAAAPAEKEAPKAEEAAAAAPAAAAEPPKA